MLDQTIIAAVSAGIATVMSVLGNHMLNRKKLLHSLAKDTLQQLFDESQKMRNELQTELLAVKADLIKIQKSNLEYAVENAELRTRIKDLEAEVATLRKALDDNKSAINSIIPPVDAGH